MTLKGQPQSKPNDLNRIATADLAIGYLYLGEIDLISNEKCLKILKGVIRSRKSKGRQHKGQKCEDTKGVIKSHKSKGRQHKGQKCEATKGVIRSRKSKGRQHKGQKCEDTKGVIRSRKSKGRQHKGQKKCCAVFFFVFCLVYPMLPMSLNCFCFVNK